MPLTADALRRVVLVAHAHDARFVELVGMAELDRATAFQGTPMHGADLRNEDLSGFDFTGADFNGADVTCADLSRALGLTAAMFDGAIFDGTTKWPSPIHEKMQSQLRFAKARNSWPDGRAPDWADDWGIDDHGRWVTFSVPAANGTRVTQRMRWIPPGRFMMGSPDREDGRFTDESPQHEVTIGDGFWMFNTACTEALWEAVTGKAPDPRRGAKFPVTGVFWADAQDFIRQLNAAKPGLGLSLPSEARWEYACRADTQTPYNFGTEISRGLVCYGANAPVPVGSLPPNGWGLYEMHGNVWEWCADDWHDSYEGAPHHGSAWVDRTIPKHRRTGAASRVVRGGAWGNNAHAVRSAYRPHSAPAYRLGNFSFRCARVQSESEERQAERRAARSKPSERSETAAATSPKRRQ